MSCRLPDHRLRSVFGIPLIDLDVLPVLVPRVLQALPGDNCFVPPLPPLPGVLLSALWYADAARLVVVYDEQAPGPRRQHDVHKAESPPQEPRSGRIHLVHEGLEAA